MAAILKLRRGTSFTNPSISEPFFNTDSNILQVGYGTTTGEHITLVKIGENTGDVSFIGDISGSNLSLSGNANIVGNIRLGGDIFLGDGDNTTDKINVNASLSGSLVPDTDGVYDLGSTSFRYNNIHVLSASIENLQVGGSGILSSSQQISDYNVFLEIDGMNVVSGSSQIDLTQTTNYISGIKTRLNSETVISGSSQVQIDLVSGFTSFSSSVDSRLDLQEAFSESLDSTFEEIASENHTLVSGSSQIDVNTTQNFQSFSSSVDNRLDEVESTSSINETNITELFSTSSNHEDRVINLESTGSNHETRITDLESFSSSLDNTFVTETELSSATSSLSASLTLTDDDFEDRITEIETTFSSSVDSRLDAQESFSESLDNTYEEKASLTHTIFSGSSQVNADTIVNFDSNVKTKLDLDNVISSSIQVTISDTTEYTDFSASIATTDEGQNDRLDSIEAYTASVDSLYEEISSGTHTLVSGSSQIEINDVTGFTSHSSSVDSRLDSLEGDSHTHSNKIELDTINQNLSKTSNVTFNDITASGNVIVSGDLTVLGTATEIQTSELVIKDKLITIASGSSNSAEADGSGIEIDGAGKSLIWDDATQSFILNAKVSSSVGFKGDGSELDNVTASDVEYDNVLNKPTLFSGSAQVRIELGSNDPNAISNISVVDGEIITGSSQVNADTIVNFDSNVKDKMNLDNVVSGSVQITNGSGILSSSNENFTTFSSSVDTRLDEIETTFSSSVDSRLDFIEGDFSQSVDSRLDLQEAFSESLDSKFLNTNGDNVVSGSTGEQLTASLDLRYEGIASLTNTLVSGSSQIDVTQTTNIETLATTGSNIFVGTQTITGSVFITGSDFTWKTSFTENFPTEVAKDIIAFEDFIGSDGISYNNNHLRLQNVPVVGASGDHTLQLNFGSGYGAEMAIGPRIAEFLIHPSGSDNSGSLSIVDNGDETTTIDLYATNVNLGKYDSTITINASNITTDSPITSSNTIEASFFYGDGSQLENVVASEITYENITGLPSGIVSGSSQIDVTQATNYSSIRQYDDSDNLIYLNLKNIVSGSTYSSPSQGTLRATINGVDSDVDLGLQSTDTPTFNSLTASNLPEHTTDIYDAVFKGTSGEFGYRTLATAAFHHVSNSIDDGTPNAIGNAGAVKAYVDAKIIAASAGDITEVNAGPGLGGGSTIGAATLNLDTGSQHFIDGVTGIAPTLPDGLVSSSDQVTQSLDTRYVNVSGDMVAGDLIISGDLTVNGTTTTINTTNLNVEDNIIELNFGGSATNGGILVKDVTGGSTISGSLLWDSVNDYWVAGKGGFETQILTTNNSTSDLSEGIRLYYTDSRVKAKLDAEGVVSGSVLTTLDGTGILSSSNENFTDFSSSVDGRIDLLESFSSSLDAGFVTETELNTTTQSLVDSISTKLNTGSYNTDSQSFDSRLDSLEGVTSENPLTFTDTSTIDFTRVDDVISADVIGGVVSGSSQIDVTQTTNIETLATTGSNTFSGINTFNSNINVGGSIGLLGAAIGTNGAGTIQLTASEGIQLLTAGGGDGVLIATNGNTTIYGGLALETIGAAATSTAALVVGPNNVVSQRTLGSNAFNSNAYEEQASSTHTLISGSSQITSVTGTIVPTTSIIPDANEAYDLGSPTNRFRDIYLSNNTLNFPSGSFGFGNDGFGFKDPFGDPAAFVASSVKIADSVSGDIISLQIIDGRLETTATDSEGAPIDSPSSNLSGSFTGSFNGTLLSTNGVISGSDQLTGSLVDLDSTQTIGGTKTFNDIVVNGTGSFAYFISTESELNTIGQSFIVLNNDTPTQRYAGLAVYDSGSAGVTASLEFDGQTNDWFYEYSDDNGVTTDHGTVLFGPAYNTKGTPSYPTNNTIQKGNGGHHLLDSNITDNGSTITLGSNVQVNGNISITGTVDGVDLQIFSSSVDSRIDTLEGVTSENPLTFTDTTTIDFTRVGNVITAKAIGGIVSGSSQVDYNSIQNTPTLYTSNQETNTTSDVTFNSVSATADIVAYASSDRRLKDNILPISNPLQKINSIGGYSFDWNVEKQHIYTGKDYGVIAQEIEEILPELVDTRENGYKAVKYDKLVSLLIEGIKELSTEVEQLKQQINK